jgi:2,3-dihydroxyphenylpropionate 1,2-dioxygenase
MRRAVLGLSHTPLLGLIPLATDVETALRGALDDAVQAVREFSPELVVIFAPDHFNGFFHEVMPPFCIGSHAEAVGDFGTPDGPLNVPADEALSLATSFGKSGLDVAASRRMWVDHGFAQPLQLLFGGLDSPPIIPIFINAAAPPAIPAVTRCIALGRAVGRHFATDPRRILVIGSGGLSHDPPIPALDHPDAGVRERTIVRNRPTPEQRAARQERVIAAGKAMAGGTSDRRPLNPEWDRQFLDRLAAEAWSAIEAMSDEDIVRYGGNSAHEVKTWIAAFASAEAGALKTRLRWYRDIPELIAGFGVLFRSA